MTCIWRDGFDHYGNGATGAANMLKGAYAEISSMQPSTVNPRTGTYCLRNTDDNNAEYIRLALESARHTLFLGAAHIVAELPSVAATHSLFQVRNSSNTPLATAVLMTTGGIEVREGSVGGTIIAQGDPIVIADGWQFIEAMFDRAAQTVEVRVNGVVAVSATGVDMGTDPFAQVVLGPTSVLSADRDYAWDDFRILDSLDGVNDDFLGDRRVFARFPVADGVPQQWTPSSGAQAWPMIDDAAPDDDGTYIESDTQGQVARVTFEPLPDGVLAVSSVGFHTFAIKTDAGTADFANNIESDGAPALGDVHALDTVYGYVPQQGFDLNPDGNIPWTAATVDAIVSELENVGGS